MSRAAFLAIFLTGCASAPPVVIKTELVEVQVRQWVPIPDAYTEPLSLPVWPARRLVNADLEDRILDLEALVQRCIVDRSTIRSMPLPEPR